MSLPRGWWRDGLDGEELCDDDDVSLATTLNAGSEWSRTLPSASPGVQPETMDNSCHVSSSPFLSTAAAVVDDAVIVDIDEEETLKLGFHLESAAPVAGPTDFSHQFEEQNPRGILCFGVNF